ncbi:hypothetical protein SOVF_203200 [Spinacia oleracea]|nr:hypothetical protein SOVF_203200 [Spinacia oleracea]
MESASSCTLNKRPKRENMKEGAREVSITAYKASRLSCGLVVNW